MSLLLEILAFRDEGADARLLRAKGNQVTTSARRDFCVDSTTHHGSLCRRDDFSAIVGDGAN